VLLVVVGPDGHEDARNMLSSI